MRTMEITKMHILVKQPKYFENPSLALRATSLSLFAIVMFCFSVLMYFLGESLFLVFFCCDCVSVVTYSLGESYRCVLFCCDCVSVVTYFLGESYRCVLLPCVVVQAHYSL